MKLLSLVFLIVFCVSEEAGSQTGEFSNDAPVKKFDPWGWAQVDPSKVFMDMVYHIWWREIWYDSFQNVLPFLPELEDDLTNEDKERLGFSWWVMMTGFAILNYVLVYRMMFLMPYDPKISKNFQNKVRFFNALYVAGSSFRAIFPRHYESRMCFFDTWLCYAALGRCVAFIAECSCGYHIYLTVEFMADSMLKNHPELNPQRHSVIKKGSYFIFVLIFVANNLSNYCLGTTNCLYCAMENSLWVVMEIVVIICCMIISWSFDALYKQYGDASYQQNARSLRKMCFFTLLVAAFTAWLDVPMYYRRHLKELAAGKEFLPAWSGWVNGFSCSIIDRNYQTWREEIAWLTQYFTLALWATNHLALNPIYAEPPNKKKDA